MIVPPVATSEAGATVSFQLEPRATNLPLVRSNDASAAGSRCRPEQPNRDMCPSYGLLVRSKKAFDPARRYEIDASG